MNKLSDFTIFEARTRGQSHIDKGTECEDYGLKYSCDDYNIFIVCDGHGDSNCFRSHLGSKFAAEIAKEKLQEFYKLTRLKKTSDVVEENQTNWDDDYVDPVTEVAPDTETKEANDDILDIIANTPFETSSSEEESLDKTKDIEEVVDDVIKDDDENIEEQIEIGKGLDNSDEIEFDLANPEPVLRQLIFSITSEWNQKTFEHFKNNPPTKEELKGVEQRYLDRFARGEKHNKAYGTTLIAALETNDYILIIQQGDSHAFIYDKDFNYKIAIEDDPNCLGNVTSSLCDSDAISAARYAVYDLSKEDISALILGTDGVEDSFYASMDRTSNYYLEMLTKLVASESVEAFEKDLEMDLASLTRDGSKDDITVAGIVKLDRAAEFKDIFTNKIVLDDLVFEKNEIEYNIPQKEAKLHYLENEAIRIEKKNSEEISKLNSQFRDLKLDFLEIFCDVVQTIYSLKFEEQQFLKIYEFAQENKFDLENQMKECLGYINYLAGLRTSENLEKAVEDYVRGPIARTKRISKILESVRKDLTELVVANNQIANFLKNDPRNQLKDQIEKAKDEYASYKEVYDGLTSRLEEVNKRIAEIKGK